MKNLVFKQSDEYKEGEIILYSEQIQQRILELAQEIADKYQGKEVVVLGLLYGAYALASDLIRALHEAGLTSVLLDFMTIKTYSKGTTATHEPTVITDVRLDIAGKIVLLVDDIVDTGKTMQFVKTHLNEKNAAQVISFTLLDKPSRRKVAFVPDYIGFTIPDIWVQGYGMDTDEKGRGDRNIIKGPYFY